MGIEISNQQSAISDSRPRLLWLGLLVAIAAGALDCLWLARNPTPDGGMVFALRRLPRLALSRALYEAFAIAAALLGLAAVALSLFSLPISNQQSAIRNRLLALLVVALCALPLHLAISWADGAQGARHQFFRTLGLVAAPRLFWLAALLALGAWLLRFRISDFGFRISISNQQSAIRNCFVAGAALATAALAVAFSLKVLGGQPHFNDATAFFFQAKTFAAGRLSSPSLGMRPFLDPGLCPWPGQPTYAFVGERWFCVALPGAPLLYAAGILLGCPWLVGPLLAGGIVAAVYLLTREAFGESAAMLALPLAALSPWLIFMSAEYLTHVPCALPLVLFLAAGLRAMRTGSWLAGLGAGLALGLAALVRPVSAAGFCLPLAAAWAFWLLRRPREAWRPTLAFLAALAVPLAALLAYNAATTGSATTFAYRLAAYDWARLRGEFIAQTDWHWRPIKGPILFFEMLYGLGAATLRWPLPEVAALGVLLVLAGLPGSISNQKSEIRNPNAPLIILLSGLAHLVVHARMAAQSDCFDGPRYAFEALPVVVVLLAGGLWRLGELLAARGFAQRRVWRTLALVLVFCFAYAWGRTLLTQVPTYRTVHGVDVRMFRVVEASVRRPAIVFVPVPFGQTATSRFYAALGRNDPALDGPVLYVRDLGPNNSLFAETRPTRKLYRWNHEKFAVEPLRDD